MKKFFYSFIFIILFLFPIHVFAEGSIYPSTNVLTIEEGSSKTFTITAYNAIGDVYISSSDSNVATVNINEWSTGMVDEKTTHQGIITVTGVNVGSTTVVLNIDAATFDMEDLSEQTKIIAVNVIKKTTTTTTTTSTTTSKKTTVLTTTSSTTKKTTTSTTTKKIENNSTTKPTTTISNKSSYFKELKIVGYDFEFKKDKFEYELEVSNDIEKIDINYQLEDINANVKMEGNLELVVGENIIKYTINNLNNSSLYTLKIHRLEKVNNILENNNESILNALNNKEELIKVNVNINDSNKIISSDILKKLKKTKKDIVYNIYDNNKLMYSIKIIGKNITNTNPINFNLKFISDYENMINKLIKNKDNLILNFDYSGLLPKGTVLTLYDVRLEDDIYIYYYNSNTNELEYVEEYKTNNNTLELKLDSIGSEYVILNKKVINSNNILFIIGTILDILIIIVLSLFMILYFKNRKKNNTN